LETYTSSSNRLDWWLELGRTLRRQQRWQSALSVYHNALKEFPNDKELHVYRALVMYELDYDVNVVIDELNDALAKDSSYGFAHFTIGKIMFDEGQYDIAEKWFSKAIGLNDDNPWWFVVRAHNARRMGEIELAFQICIQIENRFPDNASGNYECSFVYQEMGMKEKTLNAVDKAVEYTHKPRLDYYLRAAKINELFNQPEVAVYYYQKVLDIDPNNKKALEKIED
jgi:tetratricopeptide (TPR) repeat protein